MLRNRLKIFATVATIVLIIALLALLSSCFGHKHSWSAWEVYSGIESRHCLRCGEIQARGGQTTPATTTPPATTPPTTTPPTTTPPTTTPPVTTPPTTSRPVTTPPATTPPVTTPPATTPLVTTPPTTTPPITTPEATTPPVTTPPVTTGPAPHIHSFGAWSVTVPADCTNAGEEKRACACGESETRSISATGEHLYGAYQSNRDATCTSDGTKTAFCADCGRADTVSDLGSMLAHSYGEYVSDDNATCTSDGTKTALCDDCGRSNTIVDTGSMLAHHYGEYVSDHNATCTSDGTKSAECCVCGQKISVIDPGSATGHDSTATTVAPSCTESGSVTYRCKNCSYVKVEQTPATGHSYGPYFSNRDASCATDGTKSATCSACGDIDTVIDVGSAKEHSFGAYTANGDATCTSDGTESAICSSCGASDVRVDPGSMIAHDCQIVTVEPSCTEKGSVSEICKNCDYRNVEPIDATEHRWSADAPSCTVSVFCLVCNEVASEAVGHSYILSGTTEASCTKGASASYLCTACSDSYTDTTSQPNQHSIADWGTYVEIIDQSSGCIRYHKYTATCSSCLETVDRIDGPYEKHAMVATIAAGNFATCTTAGQKTFVCSAPGCSYSYTEAYEDPSAHAWVKDVGASTASLTVYGCSCGESKRVINASAQDSNKATVDSTTLGEIGTVELENATIELDQTTVGALSGDVSISALATEPSLIVGMTPELLEKIGESKVYDFGMTANGVPVHHFSGQVTVRIPYELSEGEDPDCIAVWYIDDEGKVSAYEAIYSNGYAVFETDHFSYYTVTRLSPEERCALYGHSWDTHTYPVSCVSDGYTMHICLRCGETVRDAVVVAKGHRMTESTVPATCTTSGATVQACEDCAYSYSVRIPAIGHSYSVSETHEESCTQSGYTVYRCTHCSGSYRTTTPQLAHDYVSVVTEPSCVKGGYTTNTCSSCGHSYITARTEMKEHAFVSDDKAPSCTEDGYRKKVCTACGKQVLLEILSATHTWDIAEPSCGRGQSCSVCGETGLPATGRHSWDILTPTCSVGQVCTVCGADGAPATGNHFWNIEAPTCVQGQICVFCGADGASATGKHTLVGGVCLICGAGNCTHSYEAFVTAPSCTEGGYTTYTCPSCGHSYVGEHTEKLGHSYVENVCSLCGDERAAWGFYAELLHSIFESDAYTVRLTDLEIPQYMNGRRVEMIELLLKIDDDGRPIGYGSCDVYDAASGKLREELDVILLDGVFYVMISDGGVDSVYMKIDASYFIGDDLEMIFALLKWMKNDLRALLIELIDLNAEAIGEALAAFVDELFVKETDSDGTVLYTADPTAMLALIERLRTSTIGELLSESEKLALESLPDLTIGELIDEMGELGLTVDRVMPILDRLAILVSEGTAQTFEAYLSMMLGKELDIDAILADEEILTMTLAEVLSGALGVSESEIVEMIDATLHSTYDVTVFDLVASLLMSFEGSVGPDGGCEEDVEVGENPDGTRNASSDGDAVNSDDAGAGQGDMIADMLSSLAESLTISFRVDASGSLLAFTVSLTAEAEGATLAIMPGMHTDIDYDALLARIEAKVDLPFLNSTSVSLLERREETEYSYEITRDESGRIVSITVKTEERYTIGGGSGSGEGKGEDQPSWYSVREIVNSSTAIYDVGEIGMIEISEDCSGYLGILLNVKFESHDSSVLYETYYDAVTDEIIERVTVGEETASTVGTDSLYLFYHPTTGALVIDPSYIGSLHEYELDMSRTEYATVCEGTTREVYVCKHCGDEVIDEWQNGHFNIEYENQLIPGANSCADGVGYRSYCTACGKTLDQGIEYEHVDVLYLQFDESSLDGLCAHHAVEYSGCLCGEGVNLFSIEGLELMLLTETTVANGRQYLYSCPDCSLVVTMLESSSSNGCSYEIDRVTTVTYGGEQLLPKIKMHEEGGSHDMRTVATLVDGATSCLDGVRVYVYCAACGLSGGKEYLVYNHETFETTLFDLEEYGLDGEVLRNSCACGESEESYYLSVSGYSYGYEFASNGDIFIVYFADDQSGDIALRRSESRSDCLVTVTLSLCFDFDGDSMSWKSESPRLSLTPAEKHSYAIFGELLDGSSSCEDGLVVYSACLYCGKRYGEQETVDMHCSVVLFSLVLSEYGLDGCLTISGCACGKESGMLDFVDASPLDCESYSKDESVSGTVYLFRNAEQDVLFRVADLTAFDRDPGTCTAIETRMVLVGYDPDNGSAELEHVYCTKTVEMHSKDLSVYTTLLDQSSSCLDGVRIEERCDDCQKVINSYEENWHKEGIVAVYDLTEYGASEGALYIYGCACGQSGTTAELSPGLAVSTDKDEMGRWEDYVLLADGYRIRVREERELDGCTGYYYRSYLLGYGLDASESYRYRVRVLLKTDEQHDIVYSVALDSGSVSCLDGVTVTRSCSRCNQSESYQTKEHVRGLSESYDLSDFGAGSACGGRMEILRCACGYSADHRVDGKCEFDYSTLQIGIYTADLYTCAVTDPACSFRYAIYSYPEFLPNCVVKMSYTILLGCDRNGENPQRTITYTDTYKSHSAWDKEEIPSPTSVPCLYSVAVTEYCSGCGEIFKSYENLDWRHVLDDDGYCTDCDYCQIYRYDANGNLIYYHGVNFGTYGELGDQESFEIEKYTDTITYLAVDAPFELELSHYRKNEFIVGKRTGWSCDGTRTYEYFLEQGLGQCYRVSDYVFYENGELKESQSGEIEYLCEKWCTTEQGYVSEPTCTQPGTYYYSHICVFCGYVFKRDEVKEDPYDHSWNYDGTVGEYVCLFCGLRNQNGASGMIPLEELASDDPDLIRIGYWNRSALAFTVAVGAVLDSPLASGESEIYLSGISIEMSNHEIGLSRSAVEEALAGQYGLSSDRYDIRITFIGEGLSDYGITLN